MNQIHWNPLSWTCCGLLGVNKGGWSTCCGPGQGLIACRCCTKRTPKRGRCVKLGVKHFCPASLLIGLWLEIPAFPGDVWEVVQKVLGELEEWPCRWWNYTASADRMLKASECNALKSGLRIKQRGRRKWADKMPTSQYAWNGSVARDTEISCERLGLTICRGWMNWIAPRGWVLWFQCVGRIELYVRWLYMYSMYTVWAMWTLGINSRSSILYMCITYLTNVGIQRASTCNNLLYPSYPVILDRRWKTTQSLKRAAWMTEKQKRIMKPLQKVQRTAHILFDSLQCIWCFDYLSHLFTILLVPSFMCIKRSQIELDRKLATLQMRKGLEPHWSQTIFIQWE